MPYLQRASYRQKAYTSPDIQSQSSMIKDITAQKKTKEKKSFQQVLMKKNQDPSNEALERWLLQRDQAKDFEPAVRSRLKAHLLFARIQPPIYSRNILSFFVL